MILVTKFQLWIGILIFWTKFPQKGLFRSKTKKVNNTIEFCIFKLVYYTTILRPIALPPLAPPPTPWLSMLFLLAQALVMLLSPNILQHWVAWGEGRGVGVVELLEGADLFLQSDEISTLKFPKYFPGIDLVSVIYVRYCHKI